MTGTIAVSDFENIQLPSNVIFTYTSCHDFKFIKNELEHIKSSLYKLDSIEALEVPLKNFYYGHLTIEESNEIELLITSIEDIKFKLKSFIMWKNSIMYSELVTKKEIDKKTKFINAQTDELLKSKLMSLLNSMKFTIVSPLEKINSSNSIEEIINELFEMKLFDILKYGKTFRENVISEILKVKAFKNKVELENFIQLEVGKLNDLIQNISSMKDIQSIINIIEDLDENILGDLLIAEKRLIAEKILKEQEFFFNHKDLTKYIEKVKGKILLERGKKFSSILEANELDLDKRKF